MITFHLVYVWQYGACWLWNLSEARKKVGKGQLIQDLKSIMSSSEYLQGWLPERFLSPPASSSDRVSYIAFSGSEGAV